MRVTSTRYEPGTSGSSGTVAAELDPFRVVHPVPARRCRAVERGDRLAEGVVDVQRAGRVAQDTGGPTTTCNGSPARITPAWPAADADAP